MGGIDVRYCISFEAAAADDYDSAAVFGPTGPGHAVEIIFSAAGPNPASIQSTVDAFSRLRNRAC
jgi:hypothetical protein